MNYICALVCLPQQVGNKTEIQQNFHVVLPLCKSDKLTYPNECSELFTCFFCIATIHIHRISNPYQWKYVKVLVAYSPKSLLLLHLQTTFHICVLKIENDIYLDSA